MELKKRVEQLLARIAAMQIPIYAGNASFFLLLSVFPIVSLLLSLLPYTPLTLEHLLGFCAQLAPDWLMRLLEYFIRTLYKSSSAAIISASVVLTLWSASKGMLSLLYGLDAVLEVRETRRYLRRRLLWRAVHDRNAAGAAADVGALCRRTGAADIFGSHAAFLLQPCSNRSCKTCICIRLFC